MSTYQKLIFFLLFQDKMEQPIDNPWDVQSLEEFHFYCCPECNEKTFTREQFINHALQTHPKSHETIPLLIQETGLEEPEIEINEDVEPHITEEYDPGNDTGVQDIETPEENLPLKQEEEMLVEPEHQFIEPEPKKLKIKVKQDSELMLPENTPIKEEFASQVELDLKLLNQNENGRYQCDLCDKSYARKHKLNEHKRIIHEGQRFQCEYCDKVLHSPLGIRKHKAKYHPNEKTQAYKCTICPYTTVHVKHLMNHVKKKHSLEFIPTGDDNDCGDFGDINLTPLVQIDEPEMNLNTEENVNFDSQTNEIPCEPSEFDERQPSMKEEVDCELPENSHEPELKKPTIKVKNPYELMDNVPIKDEEPEGHETMEYELPVPEFLMNENFDEYHKCDHCDKSYKQRNALAKHVKEVHLENKQFQCEQCDKAFSFKYKLNQHVKTVHDGVTYDCDSCDKVCLSYVGLRTHKATYHPTENTKVYHCESCSYQSTNSSNFWRHLRSKNHLYNASTSDQNNVSLDAGYHPNEESQS